MQARKIKYDVVLLTEERRRYPLNAAYDIGEEVFFGKCDRWSGYPCQHEYGKDHGSLEQLPIRIGSLRKRRCGSTPASTFFIAYALTSSYEEEENRFLFINLGKFYREDHAFHRVTVGEFNAEIGLRKTPKEVHIGAHSCNGTEAFLSEVRRAIMSHKVNKTVLLFKERDPDGIIHTELLLSKIEKALGGHIHTASKLTEVALEYKTPLCLTFNLKKAFDSIETEAITETLYKGHNIHSH
ncbi:hypothetical protein RB195_003438 [Necator americanus]|uniref:Reverse transcriptase domain-containing protein n=1 Tax=Necator americanus TaxID=51031 RepID=A0ABR1DNJ3_NECAM